MFQNAISQAVQGTTLERVTTRTRVFRPDGSLEREVEQVAWRLTLGGGQVALMGAGREEEEAEDVGGEEEEVVERTE